MKHFKIVVERHPEGYVAYPLGMKGVVAGEGDSYDAAVDDVKSAISFISRRSAKRQWTSTLRTICTQAGISRQEFERAYRGR